MYLVEVNLPSEPLREFSFTFNYSEIPRELSMNPT